MGWFRDIFGFSGQDIIDPILPESVKSNPIQSALSIIGAPFTGGASLAGLIPFGVESGLGQVGVEVPDWIPGLVSGMMLPGTFTGDITLPGFGEGGMFAETGLSEGLISSFNEATALGGPLNIQEMLATIPETGGGAGFGGFLENLTKTLAGGDGGFTLPGFGEGGAFEGLTLPGFGEGGALEGVGKILSGITEKTGGFGDLLNVALKLYPTLAGATADRPKMDIGGVTGAMSPEQQFQRALDFMGKEYPYTLGAREEAARRLTETPFGERVSIEPVDYAEFGPTTFEEALGTQEFQNIWPDIERQIKHGLSLSGMADSPALAQLLGEARGEVGTDIGKYLADIGQRRGELEAGRRASEAELTEAKRRFDVASMLGLDPMGLVAPFAETGLGQARTSAELEYDKYLRQLEQFEATRGEAGTSIERILNDILTAGRPKEKEELATISPLGTREEYEDILGPQDYFGDFDLSSIFGGDTFAQAVPAGAITQPSGEFDINELLRKLLA